VKILGKSVKIMEILGKLWKIWENYGKSGKIMGKSGKFWKIWEILGKSWDNDVKNIGTL
jgi:hypothetical protein